MNETKVSHQSNPELKRQQSGASSDERRDIVLLLASPDTLQVSWCPHLPNVV
jgi:hypothetical protein